MSALLARRRPEGIHVTKRYYATRARRNMYITTPIFYVNNEPHIGHLYTAVLTDAIARYNRMLNKSVILTTGTDEHGTKVQEAAALAKTPVSDYCNKISKTFHDMCDDFFVDYSKFTRTTDEEHIKGVQHFWTKLEEKGHIYTGHYSGWYCKAEEAFVSGQELQELKNKDGEVIKCNSAGQPVEWTEEDNFKFRLSAFQDDLRHWLRNADTVKPKLFHEMLSRWVEEGICLQDLSISRPRNRVTWAIPVPGHEDHSIYVWLDALVSYLTSQGYPDNSFRKSWPPDIQVIGKDILKFHGVYWPALLIAAGLEPPRTLLCHSHWKVEQIKMSKSIGNVISPFKVARESKAENLRYYLLRQAVLHSDSDYREKVLAEAVNSELFGSLMNLLHRCFSKAINPNGEVINAADYINTLQSEQVGKFVESLTSLSEIAQKHYEEHNLRFAIEAALSVLASANQLINNYRPWHLMKQNDRAAEENARAVISLCLEAVRVCSLVLHPIVPQTTSDILDALCVPQEKRTWHYTVPAFNLHETLETKYVTRKDLPVYKRVAV